MCPIFVGSYMFEHFYLTSFFLQKSDEIFFLDDGSMSIRAEKSSLNMCQLVLRILRKCAQFLSAWTFATDLIWRVILPEIALKYCSKMMDRYQLEQKSSRDMWQLGLDIYKNWLRLTKLCHDAWPIYLVLLWFTVWITEFVSPNIVFISYYLMNKIYRI